jgi:amino acid transporter
MDKKKNSKKLSLAEVVSMAVGTMIGASIFSIFGVGAKMAGKNLIEVFVLSGVYALIVAYTYAKLGGKIISNAGPIAFILEGIGDNILTGALSLLIWLTYVVSVALFSKGFTGYFLPFFHLPVTSFSVAATEVLLILFFTALNFFGSKAVGKAEFYLVLFKLVILLLFIAGGLASMKVAHLSPDLQPEQIRSTLFASVIFFLSYMGFGLIVNASENIKNPEKNIPRAIYISIAIVMFIYVGVAAAVVGNLSIDRLTSLQENALAEAAKPFLGKFGFFLISLGALISISSAMNATIFGGANISYSLAKDGELPEFFERKLWFKSREGLYITSGLGILVVLLFHIEEIAALTSSIFTIIYIVVIYSHLKLADRFGGNKIVILINLVIITGIFLTLLYYQFKHQPLAFYGTISAIGIALLVEILFRKIKSRDFSSARAKSKISGQNKIGTD